MLAIAKTFFSSPLFYQFSFFFKSQIIFKLNKIKLNKFLYETFFKSNIQLNWNL